MTGRDRVGSAMLLAMGVLAIGTSVYFMFLRPPMLPEDARFTGVELADVAPRMAAWLHVVFRTWGGFMAGFGVLLIAIAVYLFTGRAAAVRVGAALAIVIAFGNFFFSNLALDSDFLPLIAAEAAIAVVTAGWLVLRHPRARPQEH